MVVFISVSSRNNLIGVGIYWFSILPTTLLDRSSKLVSLITGTITEFNIYVKELTAIQLTISRLLYIIMMESY